MDVSPQVNDIIELLSAYAGDRLHDPAGLGSFLQHAHDRGSPEAVGELAFKGKYLSRLQLTMRRQTPESELYEKLEQEFSRTVHEFHAMVSDFFADAEEERREIVQRHYLAVTHDALRRLMQLAEDLTWLKNWELEMTQDGSGAAGRGAAGTDGANHEPGSGGNSGRDKNKDEDSSGSE